MRFLKLIWGFIFLVVYSILYLLDLFFCLITCYPEHKLLGWQYKILQGYRGNSKIRNYFILGITIILQILIWIFRLLNFIPNWIRLNILRSEKLNNYLNKIIHE